MALGVAGKADVTLEGSGKLPGRKRKRRTAAAVAARVAKFRDVVAKVRNVQTLNPGYFMLERLRTSGAAKKRSVLRKDIAG